MSLEERARRERLLAAGAKAADLCRKCTIGSQRRNNVYGEGDPSARLMLIGEGPGETEDLMGRPFIGRAGQLLDKMIGAIGLAREDVYICNTVKCRPTLPGTRGPRNRAPEPDEMANCRPFLDEQIDIIRPHVILALGAPAAKSFLGRDFRNYKNARPLVRRAARYRADGDVSSRVRAASNRRRTGRRKTHGVGRSQSRSGKTRRTAG